MDMLPRTVADRSFLLAMVLADHMRAESPRHLDAVKHELLHAVALGITAADPRSCAAYTAMRSDGKRLARLARDCGVFSPETEKSKQLPRDGNPDDREAYNHLSINTEVEVYRGEHSWWLVGLKGWAYKHT